MPAPAQLSPLPTVLAPELEQTLDEPAPTLLEEQGAEPILEPLRRSTRGTHQPDRLAYFKKGVD